MLRWNTHKGFGLSSRGARRAGEGPTSVTAPHLDGARLLGLGLVG